MLLGKSSLHVPPMGVGAMTWGDAKGFARLHPAKTAYGGAEGFEEEKRALEGCIAAGVNLFDTAAMYSGGASERRLGELIQGKDVLIASKFPGSFSFKAENFPKELEASLARLRSDSIDLYQHHFPSNRVSIPQLMEQLANAVEERKVKAVDVSNYSAEQMREAHMALAKRGIPVASNQVEYSLLHRQPETNGVLDACRELGITLIAYSPLAGGALTGKYSGTQKAKGLRRFLPNFSKKGMEVIQPVIKLLREIGERYSKTPNVTATAAAQATETSSGVLNELDKLLEDSDIPYHQGHLAWKQEKPIRVNLSGPSWDYAEIDKKVTASNFILKSDITWQASGIIVCGVTFRSEPDLEKGKQYQFVYLRLSGLPAWEIEVFDLGRFKNTPTKTQYAGAIDQGNGAMNHVVLIAQDEKFTLFINGDSQGRYFDYSKQRMDRAFPFNGSQDSGKGSCKFENSWVWILE